MALKSSKTRLVRAIELVWEEKRAEIERKKRAASKGTRRKDFVWHYLLQSFATMGRASGWKGLIGNPANYQRLRYPTLAGLSPAARSKQVFKVCRAAKIRMPDRKARFILACFEEVKRLGGPSGAKRKLMSLRGRESKIEFLDHFTGIGPKYARNIMMDVYHPDFRDCIAIDVRIKSLLSVLGIRFRESKYMEHEKFLLEAAHLAGLSGWELDRLMFNFGERLKQELELAPVRHPLARRYRDCGSGC